MDYDPYTIEEVKDLDHLLRGGGGDAPSIEAFLVYRLLETAKEFRAAYEIELSEVERLSDSETGLKEDLDERNRYIKLLEERKVEMDADLLELQARIKRSGLDESPCKGCGETVICVPDGLPMCKKCAEENT